MFVESLAKLEMFDSNKCFEGGAYFYYNTCTAIVFVDNSTTSNSVLVKFKGLFVCLSDLGAQTVSR